MISRYCEIIGVGAATTLPAETGSVGATLLSPMGAAFTMVKKYHSGALESENQVKNLSCLWIKSGPYRRDSRYRNVKYALLERHGFVTILISGANLP